MTGTTADGAGTEQTTGGKRTRIRRTGGRNRSGVTAARVASLYELHGAMVLAICRRLLRDANEAEDAAQQTFLSAQRALQNGSSPREPAAWLATIARNECVARTRARGQLPLPSDAEPAEASPDAHSEALRREKVESLRDAIGSLPAQQREAILLREVRGLSYEEVAASLAVSPSAVESLLFRARKGLQLRLRNAWAALSPVGWLAGVRDLGAQVVAAGDPGAGPAAAKAVVIGLGAAAIAGGALVGPGALHPGPPHASRQAAAPHTAPATRHASTTRSATAGQATPPAKAPGPAVSVKPLTASGSRPAVLRLPAARSEDRHPSVEPRSGEDRSESSGGSTQATTRHTTASSGGEDSHAAGSSAGASSAAGGDASQTESEHAASGAPPTFDATSQTGPTLTTVQPRVLESESSDSASASGGGEHETESGD
jgi:RNA polymerase sigma factor (sigma-70 family)